MASDESGSMKQENQDSSTGFQVQANAGSQVNQAAQDINQTINQTSEGAESQAIGQVYGGVVVYVSGGQAVINQPQSPEAQASESEAAKTVGPNPYKGLLAFHEKDRALYFGRSREIETLWNQFRDLHEQTDGIRLLPIYGPSGSGKSSLARAGLIPELGQRPLPGRDRARVAVMVPGTKPLQALAGILARIAEQDAMAVGKTREFAKELALANEDGEFDGLHRIASLLPEIQSFPLVVLIDQFEEVYSLGEDVEKRDALIANLLYAAKERSQYVSVILTMRNDFVGETHRHPELGRLFSTQGFLVPPMDDEALREVIALPAEQAGHPLDDATIQLLIEQTEGREGALPLLQFALTRIWEGLAEGNTPAKTLEKIGGVGGALAGEAQRVYDGLSESEQEIARRLFLGLVRLGEGTRDTRRRASVSSLMARADAPEEFRQVIERFTAPGVRLVTVSAEGSEETAEVTHEALFEHWRELNVWLDGSRDDLRFERRLDETANYWQEQGRPDGLLWRNPDLGLLRNYHERLSQQMSHLQMDFFKAAVKQEARQRVVQWLGVTALGVLATGMAWFAWQSRLDTQRALARQWAAQSKQVSTLQTGPLLAVEALEPLQRWHKEVGEVNDALRENLAKLPLIALKHEADVDVVSFSPNGQHIATVSSDGMAAIWDVEAGNHIATLKHEDEGRVWAVNFSPDGKRIITDSLDGSVMAWEIESGNPIVIPNHEDDAWVLGFSLDGKRVATATRDGTTAIWDIDSGSRISMLNHEDTVYAVSFSPDGQRITTASNDGTVGVWDVEAGKLITTLKSESGLGVMNFSPDGQRIATASNDGTIGVWDVGLGKRIATLKSESEFGTYAVTFSPGGQRIVTVNRDSSITGNSTVLGNKAEVWDVESGSPIAILNHESSVTAVAFSPDGQRIATASQDRTAGAWDVESGNRIATLNHDAIVNDVSFSPDGQRIATASSDGMAEIWNVEAGNRIATLHHKDWVHSTSFSPDEQHIATASNDGTAGVWEIKTGNRIAKLHHEDRIWAVSFSPDGQRIATASADGTVGVWDVKTGNRITTFDHKAEADVVSFSPDGQHIAIASNETTGVWNVKASNRIATISHKAEVDVVSFSSDGRHIAIANGDRRVRVWEVETSNRITTLNHKFKIRAVSFSPDGKHIATAGDDGTAEIWEVKTGKHLVTLNHEDRIEAASFSPDGKRIATASFDGTAGVWEVKTGKRLVTLNHESLLHSVSFSPDGQYIASASGDGTAGVWEVQSGNRLATLDHGHWVTAVSFSPDGKRIATASTNGTAGVHWLWSRDLAAESCERLHRNFTAFEWKKYHQTDLSRYRLTCENLPVHPTVLAEAQKLAEDGKVRESTKLYRHLLKVSRKAGQKLDLDPLTKDVLEQKPKVVALKFSAVAAALSEAQSLAQEGSVEQAIGQYREALKLNPEIDLNPDTWEVEQDPEAVAKAVAEASTK